METPTYEEFVASFADPEIRENMERQFKVLMEGGISEVMNIIMNDPTLSIEQVEALIRN